MDQFLSMEKCRSSIRKASLMVWEGEPRSDSAVVVLLSASLSAMVPTRNRTFRAQFKPTNSHLRSLNSNPFYGQQDGEDVTFLPRPDNYIRSIPLSAS